ncbi:unnamed protein product [Bursaphelenchus okinawaensis]|uniref:Mos1 transposase HTH domain-containing protein n=1 Tax=Bursaphelenchus okinawaensis TaxID=465554 RepID=A0A811K9H1_9BILA|nr:unnamed protein product [Bursaphelenchus okinawaensis]CAG9095844.1 unnamed protein product [Bursaphelenchus okinawaensis]
MLDRKQIRAILLYEYKNGMKASDVSRCLNNVFGPGTISDRTVQWWFTKFKGGDESLEDETRSGRPSEVDLELLGKIVDEKPNISSRELAQMMNVSHTTVVKKLKEVKKLKGYAENEMMLLAADQSTEQGCRPKEEVCKLTEQSHKAMEQSHKPLEHSINRQSSQVLSYLINHHNINN